MNSAQNTLIEEWMAKTIEDAIQQQASDIHIEPLENELRIRFRVDGKLIPYAQLPKDLHAPLVTHIKLSSRMAIDENRLPQDGKWRYKSPNHSTDYDLRISLIPFIYGEGVVLRLLENVDQTYSLSDLGFAELIQQEGKNITSHTHGLFLVTGPTGSGKSTTIYTLLREINNGQQKILTVEDPVEYTMKGVNQVSVNARQGLSFSSALRAFMRQAPNVLFVGEIRDAETAEITVQAALTGHLVFSTLHTNDALSTLTRLNDLGISTSLLLSVLRGVLAQRLVRIPCPHCAKVYPLEALHSAQFRLPKDTPVLKAVGCSKCHHTGYHGRTALYEYLPITKEFIQVVRDSQDTTKELQRFLKPSMRTCGAEKIKQHATTLEEVLAQLII